MDRGSTRVSAAPEPGSGPPPARPDAAPAAGQLARARAGAGTRGRIGVAAWAAAGTAVAAATARVLWAVATEGTGAPGAARPEDLVLVGLAWLGVALALWLAVGSGLALLAMLPGAAGRLAAAAADHVTPLAVRKVLTLVLGASVGSLALPPASVSSAGSLPVTAAAPTAPMAPTTPGFTPTAPAAPLPGFTPTAPADATDVTDVSVAAPALPTPGFRPSAPERATQAAATAASVSPGFRPTPVQAPGAPVADAPAGAPAATAPALSPGFRPTAPVRLADGEQGRLLAPSPRPSAVAHGLVTVRRGDTLWSIARDHLGPEASDAEVARAWPRWYAANRAAIGADPDLLVPGQQLVPPGPDTAASATAHHSVPKE